MRVIVLGATGMLGHQVWRHLQTRPCIEAFASVRSVNLPTLSPNLVTGVDASNTDGLLHTLDTLKVDAVINCIGVTPRRKAATDDKTLFQINTRLPQILKRWCEDNGSRLIHFSTDCVFDGSRGPYSETSPISAKDAYGQTKAQGEVTGSRILTLRSSILGPELTNHTELYDWVRRQDGKVIRGFANCLYSGVTTKAMANIVSRLLTEHSDLSGLYQIASQPLSKFELVTRIRDSLKLNIEILPDKSVVCDRRLNGDRFLYDTQITVPSWNAMLEELALEISIPENGEMYAI